MRLSLAVSALLFSIPAAAQVSVLEPATRAVLVDGRTTISLAMKNPALTPVEVRITLEWLAPDGKIDGKTQRDATLAPGESTISIAHPLSDKCDPLTERLEYVVIPTSRNYTAFTSITGRLSFAQIADYAFTLGVLTAGIPRPGHSFEVRALTAHPLTGRPVPGVTVKAEAATAVTGPDGVAILHIQREPDDDGAIDVTARIGDVTVDGESTPLPNAPDTIHAYTDKPIYQPGQTMHVRLLAIDGSGQVSAGRECELRIVNESDDLAYSATVKTSRFGVASTDWEIPPNAEPGRYTINLKTDETDHYFLRSVNIRNYELPSFRVTAAPDHLFYLPGQKPQIEIRGEYLFGKPVTAGRVRIAEADDEKATLAEGSVDGEGHFRANLDLHDDFDESHLFEDRHLVAFLTDLSTNRTEQRKFDVRLSRDPVHIYGARQENYPTGRRLYVTTYSPDGGPLRTEVEVASHGTVLGSGKTNRFGLVRIDLPPYAGDAQDLEIRAVTADGLRARMEGEFDSRESSIWLRTERSLYRAGEAIKCMIGSDNANAAVLLMATDEKDRVVWTKSLHLRDGKAEVEIPYDKRFGRMLNLGAASAANRETASRRVYFPGPADLLVKAAPVRATHRPGETATILFQASTEAALGIAVVDQSVLERAATDSAFGGRRWFDPEDSRDPNLGGITEEDLVNLDPAKIDAELQLVGEVMAPVYGPFVNNADDPAEEMRQAFENAGPKELAPVQEALDQHYLQTLEYPRDEASFYRIAGGALARVKDPWLRPFYPRFSIEGANAVVSFVSAGPDKQLGTADDYTALTIRRKWFAPYEALMRDALHGSPGYPNSADEFGRLLEKAGIRFEALRDPWGSAMQVSVRYSMRMRQIQIQSAGADKVFGTPDDLIVAEFSGPYFSGTELAIDRILSAAPDFPGTPEEFRALLAKSGMDFDALRDPWGHAYYLAFRDDESFADQTQIYTYRDYNGPPEERKQITPTKQTTRIIEIRSAGEDGVRGTYDDFAVATLRRILRAPQTLLAPLAEGRAAPPAHISGTGTIEGTVKDPAGAVVPNVEVTLNATYVTRTDQSGKFAFRALPPGKYQLMCKAPGFQPNILNAIPVVDGQISQADMVLRLGTTAEMVEVAAEASMLNTASAQITASAVSSLPLSTPRVREYFPETLYWQPELVTDGAGRASVRIKLADSVTTWHVAVIGSTLDGRIAEGSADIRAFQPFLVDLDLPPVLTVSDQIALPVPVRNYLEQAQKVAVTATLAPELRLVGAVAQPGPVEPSSSANAVVTLRAESASKKAPVRVTAIGGSASDAVEKPVSIHPDGERRVQSLSSVVESGQAVPLAVGAGAIPGSIEGEVKIYPSLLARVLESIEALLQSPHGCAEQTISTAYPNLLFLTALQESQDTDEVSSGRALKNLRAGYQRLLGYQDSDGGFTYWGHGDPDVALTAYALTFLADAAKFIAIDEDRLNSAREWLAKQKTDEAAANAIRVQALAHTRSQDSIDIDEQLGGMARRAAAFGDPYAMAAYALAAMEASKPELAGPLVEQLDRMAQNERGFAYWALRANTPFHGWGRAGQVETTALVVSALGRWRKMGHNDAALNALIDRGGLFLLQNADADGGWGTSQSTVRALTALLDSWSRDDGGKATEVEVRVNGVAAGKVSLPIGRTVRAPLVVDVSRFLRAGANEVSLAGFTGRAQQVQLTARWYDPWGEKRPSNEFDMQLHYRAVSARVNDAIACDVVISRPAFRGYGMMIADVGLPPGAEVDRGILEDIVSDRNSGVDSYEIAADHVTFYVWPRAADVKFRFLFRTRYAIKARSAQSTLYDFYNPDARVVLPPQTFIVGQ